VKNLLVTGGCGFIGTNFIRYLLLSSDFKVRIINVDSFTYAGNLANLKDIAEEYGDRYVFIKEDICEKDAMDRVFKEYEIDGLCHFAAESHVDRSIIGPDSFIKTNINGTFNLLELARLHQDKLVLFHHVSTDEVFGSLGKTGFFKEETPYDPSSPYSASKAASDHLVRAYSRTYGLPVTISNCSNNYGPFQFPEKLIPLMILNAFEKKPLPVYGDGQNIRDWLYVEDHCKAIWTIMNNGKPGETYNVGGLCERTNIDIVELICQIVDEIAPIPEKKSHKDLITFVDDRPGHDRRYAIDCSKIKRELGWEPEESFEKGIKKTIKWYIDNKEWVEDIKSGEYKRWIQEHYQKSL